VAGGLWKSPGHATAVRLNRKEPGNWAVRIMTALMLPTVCESSETLATVRQSFSAELDAFIEQDGMILPTLCGHP